MGKPTIIEMIEYVKDKLGENQAFEKLGIDRKTYYNYKGGGNPNKRKAKNIEDVYSEISMNVPLGNILTDKPSANKNPGQDRELVNSLNRQIELLNKEVANCDSLKETLAKLLSSDLVHDHKIKIALDLLGQKQGSFVLSNRSTKGQVKG